MHVPSVGAMQFQSEDLRSSYGFAAQFSGPGGHVAMLPEIMSARAALPFDNTIWGYYYTTASCEYFGRSAGGVPIVIVTHGNGPVNDSWTAEAAYLPVTFRGDGRPLDESGRIPPATFRKLEQGAFGPVSVIEFSKVAQAYPEGWSSYLRLHQLERDPLLQARLGPDWYRVAEKLHQQTLEEGLDGFNRPLTVHSNVPYDYWRPKDELPLAHLLVTKQAVTMHAEGERFVGMDIEPHERTNASRCIGVRAGSSLADVHRGLENLWLNPHQVTLPYDGTKAPSPTFFALKEFGGVWYSCVRKEGCAVDTGWPEFRVTAFELVGEPGTIVAKGERFFLRYDMAEVMWNAPEGANAYYCGEAKRVFDPDDEDECSIQANVYYCRVTLDTTQRCVSKSELEGTFEQRMQLIARTM
jgi:hypothetical protein